MTTNHFYGIGIRQMLCRPHSPGSNSAVDCPCARGKHQRRAGTHRVSTRQPAQRSTPDTSRTWQPSRTFSDMLGSTETDFNWPYNTKLTPQHTRSLFCKGTAIMLPRRCAENEFAWSAFWLNLNERSSEGETEILSHFFWRVTLDPIPQTDSPAMLGSGNASTRRKDMSVQGQARPLRIPCNSVAESSRALRRRFRNSGDPRPLVLTPTGSDNTARPVRGPECTHNSVAGKVIQRCGYCSSVATRPELRQHDLAPPHMSRQPPHTPPGGYGSLGPMIVHITAPFSQLDPQQVKYALRIHTSICLPTCLILDTCPLAAQFRRTWTYT